MALTRDLRKVLSFLVICILLDSFAMLCQAPREPSGWGDVLEEVYGSAGALSLRYTGSEVAANFGVSCTNYYLDDATCVYSFKISLTKLGGPWPVQVSANDTSGGGVAPANDDPDAYRNWYSASQSIRTSARNLVRGASYRINTYSRLTVSVPGVGSEDWFTGPFKDFRP